MTDLQKLIEAVEAGTATTNDFHCAPFDRCMNGEFTMAVNAYHGHGDVNAALALHKALLPGFIFSLREGCRGGYLAHIYDNRDEDALPSGPFDALSSSPDRALLLAVLRAYAAQREDA